MDAKDRIEMLEDKIDRLQKSQAELFKQLGEAQREQWQGRIDELELQARLGTMEANDQVQSLMGQLQKKWDEARSQLDETASTAVGVTGALRSGLESAVHDVRQALIESRKKLTS